MRKGELTRAAILEAALDLAARDGLEGLTIGLLAERMQMSKSGVFAHFGSREDLQIAVVEEYHRRFQEEVFRPAIRQPRGLPRLQALFSNWIKRVTVEISQGCVQISGAAEYDDRPGAVREALVQSVSTWRDALLRAARQAIEAGHLRADTDPKLLAFELRGLILALHHDARFLNIPDATETAQAAFERLIAGYLPAPPVPGGPSKHPMPVD
jgi:AcrR family transcriptional regulator